jgi:ATP-binding cassette subfamily C exporter for protease/lipase
MLNKLQNSKNEIASVLQMFKRTFVTVGVFSAISNLRCGAVAVYVAGVTGCWAAATS